MLYFFQAGYDFGINLDRCPPPKGNSNWNSYRLADLSQWINDHDIAIPQFKGYDLPDVIRSFLLWIMSPYRSVLHWCLVLVLRLIKTNFSIPSGCSWLKNIPLWQGAKSWKPKKAPSLPWNIWRKAKKLLRIWWFELPGLRPSLKIGMTKHVPSKCN